MVCGVRVEAVEDPLMREMRYLDKLVDELAKGKAMGGRPAAERPLTSEKPDPVPF